MTFIRIGAMTLNLDYVVRVVEHRRTESQVAAGHYATYFTVFLAGGEKYQFVGPEAEALEHALRDLARTYEAAEHHDGAHHAGHPDHAFHA